MLFWTTLRSDASLYNDSVGYLYGFFSINFRTARCARSISNSFRQSNLYNGSVMINWMNNHNVTLWHLESNLYIKCFLKIIIIVLYVIATEVKRIIYFPSCPFVHYDSENTAYIYMTYTIETLYPIKKCFSRLEEKVYNFQNI